MSTHISVLWLLEGISVGVVIRVEGMWEGDRRCHLIFQTYLKWSLDTAGVPCCLYCMCASYISFTVRWSLNGVVVGCIDTVVVNKVTSCFHGDSGFYHHDVVEWDGVELSVAIVRKVRSWCRCRWFAVSTTWWQMHTMSSCLVWQTDVITGVEYSSSCR